MIWQKQARASFHWGVIARRDIARHTRFNAGVSHRQGGASGGKRVEMSAVQAAETSLVQVVAESHKVNVVLLAVVSASTG